MRSRKSKTEEHVDHHRWVISYADFITLLFAFFVVMYAISSVNTAKYKSLSEGMKSAFNKMDKEHEEQSKEDQKKGPHTKKVYGQYQDGLDEINQSLSELEDKNYKINRQKGWIELDIKSGALFGSGDVDLKADALVKLMRLAGKLKKSHAIVSIEGYTDNMPIETPQYPSNWELSAARAAAVGRVLNSYGIDTSRLMVTGYGEQYPISDNTSDVGRALNRRVSIIIAVDRNNKRLLNPALNNKQLHSVVVGK
ncbi:flagellar motor protein MotB [Legionella saoudiensis]|uniref:flagellar motor protein MotB n=1 Tax=Legionella saoudiensis TaxID=1750561 RepID=UPI00072FC759|nr:flagellar motor protein MotB [Legionella saoudiensis]